MRRGCGAGLACGLDTQGALLKEAASLYAQPGRLHATIYPCMWPRLVRTSRPTHMRPHSSSLGMHAPARPRPYASPKIAPRVKCDLAEMRTTREGINNRCVDAMQRPAAYVHELGHNLGLEHSGLSGGSDYGDLSGTMGFCCDLRCYNSPHLHQLGWAAPLALINGSVLHEGEWAMYGLPPAAATATHFVHVTADWSSVEADLFLSYRWEGHAVGHWWHTRVQGGCVNRQDAPVQHAAV